MTRAMWMSAVAPLVLCLSGQSMAQADVQTGNLRGAVVDAAGAVIAGADVVVFREGTTIAHRTSDAQGEFTFAGEPREYRVFVRAPGFQDLRSSPVPFGSGSLTRLILTPGPVTTDTEVPPSATLKSRGSRAGEQPGMPVPQVANSASWEYGVLAQGGVGTEDRSDYKFLQLGVHAGKILTPNLGSGLFQGNFEYAVEVFPFWQSYTPRFSKISCTADPPAAPGTYTCSQPYTVGGTYTGVSVTPIMLRWNLTHGQRWMPWIQGAGGVIWTDHKYPAIGNTNPADTASNGPHGDTSVWNFTPQFGIGTHYFLKPRRSLDFSANAVHISSASLGDKNPGVNASIQFSVGYTWWK